MPTSRSQPTARQREFLSFIKAFTDRWGVPPSYEEIARHFDTSSPSVNGMVKTLERHGFLSRVPGAARTLRVLVSDGDLRDGAPTAATPADVTCEVAVRLASIAIERLVPALEGAGHERIDSALGAVFEALEITLRVAGASDEQQRSAADTLLRVASIAQGDSPETRPGRKLPWWRRPRPRS